VRRTAVAVYCEMCYKEPLNRVDHAVTIDP
jgi:hypothetical protein